MLPLEFDGKQIFTGLKELLFSNKESKAKMINFIDKRLSEASCIVMYAKRDTDVMIVLPAVEESMN